MPGKRATPEQIAEVIAFREAGYSSATICHKTGLSPATITRISSRHSIKKSSIKDELIESARQSIVDELSSDIEIRDRIKKLVLDNMAHSELCRNKLLEALGRLTPLDTDSAATVIRACTSYATAIKASSDAVRPLLKGLEEDDESAVLPELVIRRMSEDDVAQIRADQRREAEVMGIEAPSVSSEAVSDE